MKITNHSAEADFWKLVGMRLREQRQCSGKSLRSVARELKVSPSYISQVELGKKGISTSHILEFCHAYQITLDELTRGAQTLRELKRN